ncbi:MAG: hypothetical protein V4658_14160 [Bacteroidota bacterium]
MKLAEKIRSGMLAPVFANGIYMLLPGLINQVLAFFVIGFSGSDSWGSIVQLQLYYYLVTAITAWGNKEFLLVHFSKKPGMVTGLWQQSLLTRFCMLLLPILMLTFIIYPAVVAIHLCCWIMLRYFTQSFESVATYYKKYKAVLISEIAAWLPVTLLFFYTEQLQVEQVLLILTLIHLCRALVLFFSYTRLTKGLLSNAIKPAQLALAAPFMLLSLAGFLQAKSDLYCISFMEQKNATGDYQVLMSYVSLCLLVPGFLITPYTADIYKMTSTALRSFQRWLNLAGTAIGLVGISVVYIIMRFVYLLDFDLIDYLLAGFYVVLPYFYVLGIYGMYKSGNQSRVMLISCSGILVNTIVCILLIPLWGITGALVANCMSQIFLFVFYRLQHHGIAGKE